MNSTPVAESAPDHLSGTSKSRSYPTDTRRQPVEAHLLRRRSALGSLGSWSLILAAGGADLAAFYVVLEAVFNSKPFLVWVAAIGFVLIAAGLSHQVGVGLANRVERLARPHPAVVAGTFAAWLALGAVAFVVRLNHVEKSAAPKPGATVGNLGQATTQVASEPQWGPALLFLLLYVAGGVLAILVGLRHTTTTADSLHHHADGLNRAAADHRSALADLTAARESLKAVQRLQVHDDDEFGAAGRQRHYWALELMSLARLAMGERATHISDIPIDGPVDPGLLAQLNAQNPAHLFRADQVGDAGAGGSLA